jgi:putative MATE family efflux protein
LKELGPKEKFSLMGLLIFSLPSIAASVLEPLASVVDTAMVGHISTPLIGSLAIATTILSSFTWMFNFLVHASTRNVSHFVAKKDHASLMITIRSGLKISIVLGVLSTLFLFFARHLLYRLVSMPDELALEVDKYFTIRLIGHPFLLIYTTLLSIMRGFADVNRSFYLVLFTTLLNIVVTGILLFILNWGIEGAAVGTVVSQIVGLIVTLFILGKKKIIRDNLFKKGLSSDVKIEFGKHSKELFGRSFILTAVFFMSTRLAAGLGLPFLAAHQILLQIWLFVSFFVDGVAMTGNILGAKFYALKEMRTLDDIFKKLLWLGFIIGGFFILFYVPFYQWVWSFFTLDREVYEQLEKIWPYVVWSQIINCLSFVYDGLLFGLGEFRFLRRHMFLGTCVTFLPFGFLSYFGESLLAIWLGLIGLNFYRLVSGYLKTKNLMSAY